MVSVIEIYANSKRSKIYIVNSGLELSSRYISVLLDRFSDLLNIVPTDIWNHPLTNFAIDNAHKFVFFN